MIEIVMPQMGESLAEGTIIKWLKAPGDRVERDEPIVEISTDKVDTDVPAPTSGILRRLVVQPGETVAVGAVVALIEPDAGLDGAGVPPPEAIPAGPHGPAPAATEEPAGHFKSSHAPQLVSFRRGAGAQPSSPPAPSPVAARAPRAPDEHPGEAAFPGSVSDRSRADVFTPAVLETARRGGLDVGTLVGLKGSGHGGRITKRDIRAYLDSADRARVGPGPIAAASRPADQPAGDASVPPEYVYRPTPDDRVVAMTPVRRKIAHHMAWSARISPHATAFAECNMANAAARVAAAKASPAAWEAGPLTYTVLVAQAAVLALADFEVLNASVVRDEIVFKPHVNLGVAVALADTHELVVPVVPRAEELSLTGLARAIQDVASRARTRALRPEDVQGGTFTLTNPGIFGGITGTPILNQPQVAILGLGAIVKKPIVIDEAIAIRPMMTVSLTFDHRAADGMVAFRFLDRLRQLLESSEAMS